jgi:hypothetical protein
MAHPAAMYAIQPRSHQEATPRTVSIEQRSRVRFPLELHVRYHSLGRGRTLTGAGSVVNISSDGVLVSCQHEIRTGTRMNLRIEWPSLLDGRIPLQLVVVGRVVRSGTCSFALVLARYQFRLKNSAVLRFAG